MTQSYTTTPYSLRILKILLVAISVVYLITFFNRYIQSDENWFGEQAYWLIMDGAVKLESLPFIFEWDTRFLVYHKLLIWIGAGIIEVFGWSIYYFKVFNFCCFLITIFMLWKYSTTENGVFRQKVIFLFLVTPLCLVKAFEFRPEVPVMMFGFASFFFIHGYLRNQETYAVLLSGLMAGLAFLTHLNGAIYCVAGFLLLLCLRDLRGVVLFSAIAIPVCVIYFIPLLHGDNLQQWAHNLRNWPSHHFSDAVKNNVFATVFQRIVNEQRRFFWDGEVAGISALFVAALLLKGRYLWKNNRILTLYTVILIATLALLGSHKAPRYLMFNIPFMVMIIVYAMKGMTRSRFVFKCLIIILIAAQVALFSMKARGIILRNEPSVQKHREIMSHIPEKAKVIGPWEIIYNEISNYSIYSYKSYEYLEERMTEPFSQVQVTNKMASLGIAYIILDADMKDNTVYHWFHNWEIDPKSPYQEFYRGDGYLILKKK